jgi:hypothetical protein
MGHRHVIMYVALILVAAAIHTWISHRTVEGFQATEAAPAVAPTVTPAAAPEVTPEQQHDAELANNLDLSWLGEDLLSQYPTNYEPNVIPAPNLEAVPAQVYYTDKKRECDLPGAFYIGDIVDDAYKIDLGYDVEYYKRLYEALNKKYTTGNRNPTPQENDVLMQVDDLIKQYARFPGPHQIKCKIELPNWYTIRPKRKDFENDEELILGDISQNASRGPPEHWAFIGRENVSPGMLDGNGLLYAKVENDNQEDVDDYYYLEVSGKKLARGAFPSFSEDIVKRLHCSEMPLLTDFVVTCGLRIDPKTNIVTFIRNNEPVAPETLSDVDIIKYFRPFFVEQQAVQTANNSETVFSFAETASKPIIRLIKDSCNAIVKELVPANVTITFSKQATLKTVTNGDGNRFYKGTVTDLQANDRQLNTEVNKKQGILNNALTRYLSDWNRYRSNVNELHRLGALLKAITVGAWILERIGRAVRWLSRSLRNRINDRIRSLNNQKVQVRARMNAVRHSIDATRASMQTSRNNYSAANSDLNYTLSIKNNVNEYIKFMNDELLKNIRNMLATDKLVLVPDTTGLVPAYWKYLSYDGNLYVMLE